MPRAAAAADFRRVRLCSSTATASFLAASCRCIETAAPLPGETEPVWSPFPVRLAEASIAIASSAGLSIEDEQSPFDVQRGAPGTELG